MASAMPFELWNAIGRTLRPGTSLAAARAYACDPLTFLTFVRIRTGASLALKGPASTAQIDRDTTSFMISFVPPKILVTRASRHSRAIRYSFM